MKKQWPVVSEYKKGEEVNITLPNKTDKKVTILRVIALDPSLKQSYVIHTWEGCPMPSGFTMLLNNFNKCVKRYARKHK